MYVSGVDDFSFLCVLWQLGKSCPLCPERALEVPCEVCPLDFHRHILASHEETFAGTCGDTCEHASRTLGELGGHMGK